MGINFPTNWLSKLNWERIEGNTCSGSSRITQDRGGSHCGHPGIKRWCPRGQNKSWKLKRQTLLISQLKTTQNSYKEKCIWRREYFKCLQRASGNNYGSCSSYILSHLGVGGQRWNVVSSLIAGKELALKTHTQTDLSSDLQKVT